MDWELRIDVIKKSKKTLMSGMLMGVFVLTVRLTQPAELPTNNGLFSEQDLRQIVPDYAVVVME